MYPTLEGVRAAASRIQPYVAPTPLIRSEVLSDRLAADVWVKNETVTAVASFKIRGALNTMFAAKAAGVSKVATSSTGNHGQGVAYAGKLLGIEAHVFMPRPINQTKAAKTQLFGGVIHEHGDDIDEAKDQAQVFCDQQQGRFLDDGNDRLVMEGAGTVALEVAESFADIDAVLIPSGGGNLSAGGANLTIDQLQLALRRPVLF